MSDVILAAINKMDPNNDNHWTVDGLAKLDTVKFLAGQSVTREELEATAPGFNREAFRTFLAGKGEAHAQASTTGTGSGGGIAPTPPVPPPAPTVIEPTKGPSDREAQVKALAEEINNEKQTIVQLERVQEKARADVIAATNRMDAAQIKLNELSPPETHQQTIRRYLDGQIKLGQDKAALRAQIKNQGVDLTEVARMIGGSPLDQAMRQRHRRKA